MSLNIKDPEARRLAQAIARATGETLTRVVIEALRERLARIERRRGRASVEELLAERRPGRSARQTPLPRPRRAPVGRTRPPEMIVDASALVAILDREPEAQAFVERIRDADVCRISVANSVELAMALESQLGPDGMAPRRGLPPPRRRRRRAGYPSSTATSPARPARLRQGPP